MRSPLSGEASGPPPRPTQSSRPDRRAHTSSSRERLDPRRDVSHNWGQLLRIGNPTNCLPSRRAGASVCRSGTLSRPASANPNVTAPGRKASLSGQRTGSSVATKEHSHETPSLKSCNAGPVGTTWAKVLPTAKPDQYGLLQAWSSLLCRLGTVKAAVKTCLCCERAEQPQAHLKLEASQILLTI